MGCPLCTYISWSPGSDIVQSGLMSGQAELLWLWGSSHERQLALLDRPSLVDTLTGVQ